MEDLRQKGSDFFLEIWNKRQFDRLDEFITKDCSIQKFGAEGTDVQGLEEIKAVMSRTIELMPDLVFTVDQCVVEEEMTVIRWLGKGTVNGKQLVLDGMTMAEWDAGKMVRGWNAYEGGIIKEMAMSP